MCELLGLSFARPIPADFSIRPFALRATDNADGWGLAWYPDRSVALLKEPLKWQASQITTFLETYSGLLARIYIAHVRHKTTGGEATHAEERSVGSVRFPFDPIPAVDLRPWRDEPKRHGSPSPHCRRRTGRCATARPCSAWITR